MQLRRRADFEIILEKRTFQQRMSQPKEIYFADQAFRKENISTENVSSAGSLFCVSLLHVRDPLGVGLAACPSLLGTSPSPVRVGVVNAIYGVFIRHQGVKKVSCRPPSQWCPLHNLSSKCFLTLGQRTTKRSSLVWSNG